MTSTPNHLKLTEAAIVDADLVSQEFAVAVTAQIEQARAYLAGDSDDLPAGFTQRADAHDPYKENERDYFIQQMSLAFAGDPHVFDEHMTEFEKKNAAANGQDQPPGSQHNAVTVNVLPFMQERLGVPNPTETLVAPGSMIRGVGLPGAQPGRELDLFEVELPVRGADNESTMARLVYFVKK